MKRFLLTFAFLTSIGSSREENSITLAHLNAKAAEQIREAAGHRPVEITANHENEVPVFEARWSRDGLPQELTVSMEGVVLSVEESIVPTAAPTLIQKAMHSLSDLGTIKKVEKISKANGITYKIDLKSDESSVTIRLDSKGIEVSRKIRMTSSLDLQLLENPDGNCSFKPE